MYKWYIQCADCASKIHTVRPACKVSTLIKTRLKLSPMLWPLADASATHHSLGCCVMFTTCTVYDPYASTCFRVLFNIVPTHSKQLLLCCCRTATCAQTSGIMMIVGSILAAHVHCNWVCAGVSREASQSPVLSASSAPRYQPPLSPETLQAEVSDQVCI